MTAQPVATKHNWRTRKGGAEYFCSPNGLRSDADCSGCGITVKADDMNMEGRAENAYLAADDLATRAHDAR